MLRNRNDVMVTSSSKVQRIDRGITAWETDYCFKMNTNLWIQWDQKRVRGNVSKLVSKVTVSN